MAAILGQQTEDKDPILNIRIRSKRKYMSFCFFTLKFLAIFILLLMLITVCVSLYNTNKGLKSTFILLDPACASCELPLATFKDELKATTETNVQAEIVTTDNYLDGGNTKEDVTTETRKETQSVNLSGHTKVKSEKLPPAEKEDSQVYYLNDNKVLEYEDDVEQNTKSYPNDSVVDVMMGYFRPIQDYVMKVINRFLSYVS